MMFRPPDVLEISDMAPLFLFASSGTGLNWAMLRLRILCFLIPLLGSISCLEYGVDGPDVIQGKEVNRRLAQAFYTKLQACGIPLFIDFIFIAPGFGSGGVNGAQAGKYYQVRDVDRCVNDYNRLPCSALPPAASSPDFAAFFAAVALLCPDLNTNAIEEPPYFQGNILGGPSNTSSSSSSSSR